MGDFLSENMIPFPGEEDEITPTAKLSPAPVVDEDSKKPFDASYLFLGDAQAILEEAPDLDTGLSLLANAYNAKDWNNEKEARDILSEYSQELRYRFKDTENYSIAEIKRYAPLSLSDVEPIEGETEEERNISKVDEWVRRNKEILESDNSPDPVATAMVSKKLIRSMEDVASGLKRTARYENSSALGGATRDFAYRMLSGAVVSPLKAIGLDETAEAIEERTDPRYDQDYGTAFAQALGMIGGTVASAIATGGPGGLGYLIASGVGEVRDRYETSLEKTGDPSKARTAAIIETGAQALGVGVSGKVIAPAARKLGAKLFGREVTPIAEGFLERVFSKKIGAPAGRITAAGVAEASEELVSSEISKKAQSVGEDVPYSFSAKEALRNASLGLVFGSGMGTIGATVPRVGVDPVVANGGITPVEKVNVTGGIKENVIESGFYPFDVLQTQTVPETGIDTATTVDTESTAELDVATIEEESPSVLPDTRLNVEERGSQLVDRKPQGTITTKDNSVYIVDEDGVARRKDSFTNEEVLPFDNVFFVEKDIADSLAVIRESKTEDGDPLRVYTDGKKLLVDGVNGKEEVPVLDGPQVGAHPVEVNKPKASQTDPNTVEYRSFIGHEITDVNPAPVSEDTSVGAMALKKTKERAGGKRIRLSPEVDEYVRDLFGGEDIGKSRYFPETNEGTVTQAKEAIYAKGINEATKEYLSIAPLEFTLEDSAIGLELYNLMELAASRAKEVGDTPMYEAFSKLQATIADKSMTAATFSAQFLQFQKLWADKIDPYREVQKIDEQLEEEAILELAAEEVEEPSYYKNLDETERAIDEEVTELQDKEQKLQDAENRSLDSDEAELGNFERDINETVNERAEEAKKNYEEKAAEVEAEVTRLEEAHTALVEEKTRQVEEETKKVEDEVTRLETKEKELIEKQKQEIENLKQAITDLEAKGKEKVETKGKEKIKKAESAIYEAERLGRNVARAKEGLEKLKKEVAESPLEDGLTTEEKSILRRLRAKVTRVSEPKGSPLSTREQQALNNYKELLANTKEKKASLSAMPEKTKLRIDNLKKLAKELKEKGAKQTPESHIKVSETNQLKRIAQKRAELRKQRVKNSDKRYLSDPERGRLKELLAKKAKVIKDKNKLHKKKQDKLKLLSEEDRNNLIALGKDLKSQTPGTTAYNATLKAIEAIKGKVFKNLNPNKNSLWYPYWLSNVLTGLGTHAVNIIFNSQMLVSIPASYMASGKFGAAKHFIKGVIEAAPTSLAAAKESFLSGQSLAREGQNKAQTKVDFVKEGPKYIRNLGYALRALSAEDDAFYHTIKEAQTKAALFEAGKKEGLKGDALLNYISDRMYNSKANEAIAMKEAQRIADNLKKLGVKLSPLDIKYTAWELMEKKRPASIREETAAFARLQTLTNTPEGFIGTIAKLFSSMADAPLQIPGTNKTVRPLRFIIPFMNIGGNIANALIPYTPLGALQSLNKKTITDAKLWGESETRNKSELERRSELGKSIIGTSLTAIMYGITSAFLDDEDPYIALYGNGPENYQKRKQLMDFGWRPFTLKVGDKYFKFSNTVLALPLGYLGSIHDKIRWDDKYDKDSVHEALQAGVMGSMRAFTDNTFLKSISDVISIVTGEDKSKQLSDVFLNAAKGFVPGMGALRQISRMMDDPIQTKNDAWAKFISGIPYVETLGTKPALNKFGEPVERSFEDRTGFLSRFYTSRVTDPDWRWLADNGYHLPDQANSNTTITTKKGTSKTEKRLKEFGARFEGIMTPEERYELTVKSGPDVRRVVEMYRQRYGNSGYQEKVQKKLSEDVSRVVSNWNKRLTFR